MSLSSIFSFFFLISSYLVKAFRLMSGTDKFFVRSFALDEVLVYPNLDPLNLEIVNILVLVLLKLLVSK